MEGKILEKAVEDKGTCFLVSATLLEYVNSLHPDYRNYEVQREVVSNTYLDNLLDTVLNKRHIPPIVLVTDEDEFKLAADSNSFVLSSFKILDGLQRTYRLNSIFLTIKFFQELMHESDEILFSSRLKISRKYSESLTRIDSSSKMLFEIREKFVAMTEGGQKKVDFLESFSRRQWFEIWVGLKPEDEVKKMLVLNAGHKPVKTKHQLELLFLNLVPIINKGAVLGFTLKREKESSSSFVKNRKVGEFHFSHLITALLSMKEGEPQTTNIDLVHETQSDEFDFNEYADFFQFEFLTIFIQTLVELDQLTDRIYGELGRKWLGREVSIVGIFAALGRYCKDQNLNALDGISFFMENLERIVHALNLPEYEEARNSLDLSKVNVGAINKKAIYFGLQSILTGSLDRVVWARLFGQRREQL